MIGFAELELGENARITGCKATNGAAIYMDLEATQTANYPGCFLYANGGQVDGSVYVGTNEFTGNAEIKITNAIDSNGYWTIDNWAALFGLTTYGQYAIEDTVNFTVYVPRTDPLLTTSLAVVPLQLLAYYISCAKGLDVDKPRNLAKSVTVE